MKKLVSLCVVGAALICSTLFLTLGSGCASTNATLFNANNLTVDLAIGSYRAFNRYYHQKTNDLGRTTPRLENDRKFANEKKQEIGRTAQLVEQARLEYKANKTTEAEFELKALLTMLDSQGSNFVALVQSFMAHQPQE